MSNQVCGYDYTVVEPMIRHERDRRKARKRVLVDGWKKADGEPIRFRSVGHAERHIRNFKKER